MSPAPGPTPARGGAGAMSRIPLADRAQGAAQHQQQQGRAEQGVARSCRSGAGVGSTPTPISSSGSRVTQASLSIPERQLGIYIPPGADGGEEGAQVDATSTTTSRRRCREWKRALNHGTGAVEGGGRDGAWQFDQWQGRRTER